jgi:metal-responsive CopG/Arc/MetJ family transcriptional regulator
LLSASFAIWHNRFVTKKKRISITLSSHVLARIDELAGSKRLRSALIERAIRNELRRQSRSVDEAADLELINAAADQLNAEAADVLEFQVRR